MAKYFVSIPIYASATFTVEANSESEAIDLAYKQGLPNICHQCAEEIEVTDFSGEDAYAETYDED